MRPIKLTMSAFGPYSSVQTIDFDCLQGRRLFLVTGATGAGKTMIFDAICYALYGKASGRDRDGENLRSHFAAEEVMTFVELEFEAAKKTLPGEKNPAADQEAQQRIRVYRTKGRGRA